MDNKFICINNARDNRFKVGEIYDLKAELGVAKNIPIDELSIKFIGDVTEYNKYPTFKRV